MKKFNCLAVGFCSLLLMLICFTSCEQEVLTDVTPDVTSPELLFSSLEASDLSTVPTDLVVPERTLENIGILDERACLLAANFWVQSSNLDWIYPYSRFSQGLPEGAWAWSNRHQLQIYLYPGQDPCGQGLIHYTNGSIGGYSGNFWDNSKGDNWIYSYSAGKWVQH